MTKDPEIQSLLRPVGKVYSTHSGLNRAEGAGKMITEPREEAARRHRMVLLGSGKDSEQMPCRMQEGVAPRHLGFCPWVLILASKT